jgi:hypothetical protein
VKRYSIFAVQVGCEREVEIAQVDSNPERIAWAVRDKKVFAGRNGRRPVWSEMYRWGSTRIQENDAGR